MTKIEFINKMNIACAEAATKNARFNGTVIYAQAALESNWGNSELARKANNLFAIKAGQAWGGEKVDLSALEWNHQYGWYRSSNKWRKYSSWSDCIIDYAIIISNAPWFKDALDYLEEPSKFLKAILPSGIQPGWATDPEYYQKIVGIAKELENFGGPKWS